MKRHGSIQVIGFAALVVLTLFCTAAVAGEALTLSGTVGEDYQFLVGEDEIYELADTDKGNDLGAMVGKRVEVTGTVEEQDGAKVLTVTSFEVIEE